MAEKDKFDEFLEEVEQDIRQERFKQLWEKYGKQASSALTAVLVVLAGYSLWSNYQNREFERQSDYYVKAQSYLEQGETSKALAILKDMTSGNKTYATFARFSEASIYSTPGEKQDLAKAVELYTEIAKDSKLDGIWRDTAQLQAISLSYGQNPKSEDKLIAELDVLSQEGRPLRALALEQKGVILYLSGKKKEAAEAFVAALQTPDAPEGVKLRAQTMAQQISSES
jgi:hypothetical protein